MQFEFYVLNYDCNKKKVIMYNIFNNINVQECAEKMIRQSLRNPKKFSYTPVGKDAATLYGFDALVKEIDGIIRCEQWARREYEIGVCDAFETDINKLEKWDVYSQAKPNMVMIAHEVLRQYKEQKKHES